LLAYHYAGNLPAYATSSANSDQDGGKESDLNGLRLVEMPSVLSGGNNNAPLRGQRYARLGVLGADACRMATLDLRSHSRPGPLLQGETGFLSINGQGQIERDLQPAVFDRGVLRRR
ncbi:MAG: penicillin-binding protein activator, partial [Chromatocurvus sp.]